MKTTETLTLAAAALAAAVSLAAPTVASAADMEKCYGVSRAGHNDCSTATSSCAGTSQVDGDGHAFVVVPEGTCEKLVNGSTEPHG